MQRGKPLEESTLREKRWDRMLATADVTQKFITTIIEIIGRKTSEEYAAVTIRNLLEKLQLNYPFLRAIEIKNTRSVELEGTVTVNDSLNTIHPKQVGIALKKLLTIMMDALGKNAGYFFIRETREKIGIDYDKILTQTMDVDLTLIQSTYIVEKKTTNLLDIQKSDVIQRVLKALIDALEKQTSKTFAITFVTQHLDALRQHFPFLQYIKVNDVRYTLGSEEIAVKTEINTIDPLDIGRAIRAILQDAEKTLADLGRNSVAGDLKTGLTREYLKKLEEMGVTIISYNLGNNAVFTQVIKTIIDIIVKTNTEGYAIITLNSLLRKIEDKHKFLTNVKVEQAVNHNEPYHITLSENIDTVSETDARRAIQQLLEGIIDSLEEKRGDEFIEQFKNALEKKYLSKLEEMGVNFHMIELHHEMFN